MKNHRLQKGYAILIVLVAVAIMLILYVVQMKPFFGASPANRPQPAGIEQHPWVLADMLVPEGKDVKLPRAPKPELTKPLMINARVSRDGEPRGTAVISFGTDGRIRGTWKCEFVYDEQTHSITAEAAGNVNVKQTFEDEHGEDKSRLFFIAKGQYTKTTPTDAWGPVEERGNAWMLGWLKPDGTVDGHITITTTRQWAAAYEFAGPVKK